MEELNEKKTKYFVIAIIILIILGVLLIVHFNNKQMVKGEDEKSDTPITTEKVTTTKKRITEEVKVEEVVYKSAVDNDNKLVYNYKLTDEITDTDVIISKKLQLNDALIEKNVIGLFDISLYDANMVKKNVSNSLITIKIPLTEELKMYENYQIVYINDKNEITDELFEVKVDSNYIEFSTTHLSVFGIIGTKKVVKEDIDLSDVKVIMQINDSVLVSGMEDEYGYTDAIFEKNSEVKAILDGIDCSYQLYYSLKNDSEIIDYKLFDKNIFVNMTNGNKYTLTFKVVVGNVSKEIIMGDFTIYDEIFRYDKSEELEESIVVGEIADKPDYDYSDKDINKDIVIDYVETPPVNGEDNSNSDNATTSTTITTNDNITSSGDLGSIGTDGVISENATIKINGNIYLVEKTDISELEMTGYLYIDTAENIIFAQDEEKILLDGLYSVTIRSKEFMLNGNKYSYEYTPDGNLVIYEIKEITETEGTTQVIESESVINKKEESSEISVEDFNELFAGEYGVIADENNKHLIIAKPVSEDSETQETSQDETVSGETKIDIETTEIISE